MSGICALGGGNAKSLIGKAEVFFHLCVKFVLNLKCQSNDWNGHQCFLKRTTAGLLCTDFKTGHTDFNPVH